MIILKYIVDLSINPKVSLSKLPCLNAQGAIQKRAETGGLLDNHEDFYLTYNHRRLSITGRCFQGTN